MNTDLDTRALHALLGYARAAIAAQEPYIADQLRWRVASTKVVCDGPVSNGP